MSDTREDTDRIPALDSRHGEDAAHDRVPAHDESATPTGQWSRRRFGKTALGITPVIATLYGRPLWAAANCTPSGWVSGNTSLHHEAEDCLGKTPGFWQGNSADHPEQWEMLREEPLNSIHGFSRLSFLVGGEPATFQQAVEGPGETPFDATDMDTRQLIRFGTAALLNAYYIPGYSLEPGYVQDLVEDAVREGRHVTPGGDELSSTQVKNFLENTMGLANADWGD